MRRPPLSFAIAVVVFAAASFATACQRSNAEPPIEGAGRAARAGHVDNVATMLQAPGRVLLDVRTEREFAAGHVPGSINVPLSRIAEAKNHLPHPDTPAVVYCAVGARAGRAIGTLESMGYTRLVNGGGAADMARRLAVELSSGTAKR